MTATSYNRGHKVEFVNGSWTDAPLECKRCGEKPTADGHDACLGELEGVKHACCGHGVEDGYIIKECGQRTGVEKND